MMDKKRLSVLVVGGAGYIGSHAARELRRRGHNAIIYDNLCTGHQYLAEGFELIVGDITDAAKLDSVLQRVDAVMHFAAHAYVGESVSNPRKYFQNNVADALSLLNAVIDSGVRKFIFSSTRATYGIPELVPITERTPRLPINPYGATKLAFENALEAYGHAYGLRFVPFHYFNAAGADESGAVEEFVLGTAGADGLPRPSSGLAILYARAGRLDDARATLEAVQALAQKQFVSPYGIASIRGSRAHLRKPSKRQKVLP